MNKNFAAPFLKKLSTKLETFNGDVDTENNLFAEFFKKSFTKTLSLVSEDRKVEFVDHLQASILKFSAHRQLLLAVLVSVLTRGKDHENTHRALDAMVEKTLLRFEDPRDAPALIEDIGHETFQRMIDSMSLEGRRRFVDSSVAALLRIDEKTQRLIIAAVPAISEYIVGELAKRTSQLNDWMRNAPRFPATPLALCDILTELREASVTNLFPATNDAHSKERFLVALSLVISCVLAFRTCSLENRLSWISVAAPEMRTIALDLQTRFFVVEAKGNVLRPWLRGRLKQYNEKASDLFSKLLLDSPLRDVVKQQIVHLLPPRINMNQLDEAWIDVQSIEHQLVRRIWDTLVTKASDDVFLPEHTLTKDTVTKVLRSMPNAFEMDGDLAKVRLGAKLVSMQPREVRAAVQNATQNLLNQVQVEEPPQETTREEDTLVDNLLREALEGIDNLDCIKARRISLGVYEFQNKAVTFVVKNGQLFVYRVGNDVRQLPIMLWLNQEIQKAQAPTSKTDTAAVLTVGKNAASTASWPFGVDDRRDQEKIAHKPVKCIPLPEPVRGNSPVKENNMMTKKVKAATKATELNRRLIRRSISWDEDTLRKLMKVGLKKDMVWRESWNICCQSYGWYTTEERLPKKHSHETLTRFIEANLGEVLSRDWLKEFLVDPEGGGAKRPRDAMEGKRKKRKKEKKKKRKRETSSSESSSEDEKPKVEVAGTMEQPPLAEKQPRVVNKCPHPVDGAGLETGEERAPTLPVGVPAPLPVGALPVGAHAPLPVGVPAPLPVGVPAPLPVGAHAPLPVVKKEKSTKKNKRKIDDVDL
eukprot:GEMP01018680.1.p1 GENE.GEMP01018680.1~~GEMP01018680.1.p1  ORF type:complete len:815 (+),score=198.93 GEMP01018680.1:202-2646(+)